MGGAWWEGGRREDVGRDDVGRAGALDDGATLWEDRMGPSGWRLEPDGAVAVFAG
jgi:hypothetical protein